MVQIEAPTSATFATKSIANLKVDIVPNSHYNLARKIHGQFAWIAQTRELGETRLRERLARKSYDADRLNLTGNAGGGTQTASNTLPGGCFYFRL